VSRFADPAKPGAVPDTIVLSDDAMPGIPCPRTANFPYGCDLHGTDRAE